MRRLIIAITKATSNVACDAIIGTVLPTWKHCRGVISGSIPILADVERASDIEALIVLTETYGLRAIINGGSEAWMLADQIAAAGLPVILAPTYNLPSSFDAVNARLGAANILVEAGVTVAFASGATNSAHKFS